MTDALDAARAVLKAIREQGWEGAGVVTLLYEFIIAERQAERDRCNEIVKTAWGQNVSIKALENVWQPIETAPRDGSPILAYNPVMGAYNTAYMASEPDERDRFPCGFSGFLGKWYCSPSHWMPMPSPPKQDLEKLEN